MKPVSQRVLAPLIVVAALVIVGLIVPYFLNADRYRPAVISAIEQATGRKVSLQKIRARLLPHPGIVLENLSLGNPPEFAPGAVFSAESAGGNLAWGPLFHGDFELTSLDVVHPRLLLLTDSRGRTNYDFSSPTQPAGRRAPRAAAPADDSWLGRMETINLDRADITFARATSGNRAPVPTFHAANFSATFRRVAATGAWTDQWESDADLGSVRMQIPGLGGPIQFRSGSLQLRRGAADAKFEADLGKAARVEGTLKIANLEKPMAAFNLNTPELNLDQLLGGAAGSDPPSPTSPGKDELLAQGHLSAQRLRFGAYEATQGSADLHLYTGRVEIAPVSMTFYGGPLGASLGLDERAQPARFSANVSARGIDLAQLLAVTPGTRGKLDGRGELTAQLSGSPGAGWREALRGNGNFAIRDGRFPGVNLGGTLQTLAQVGQALGFGGAGGETRFSLIAGDFAISRGRVASQRIHVDSTDGTVDLRGSCGLDGSLDYRGQAILTPGSSAAAGGGTPANPLGNLIGGVFKQNVGRITVPFALLGTLESPRILPGVPGAGTSSPSQPKQPQQKSIFDIFSQPPL